MKNVFLSLMFAACPGIFFSLNAQGYKIPEKVGKLPKLAY